MTFLSIIFPPIYFFCISPFQWKATVNFIYILLPVNKISFSPVFLGYFPAFLVLGNLIMVFLGTVFFMFLLLGVPWNSWTFTSKILWNLDNFPALFLKSRPLKVLLLVNDAVYIFLSVLFWFVHCYDQFKFSNLFFCNILFAILFTVFFPHNQYRLYTRILIWTYFPFL